MDELKTLSNIYSLLDFSEKLLDDIENQPLSELPRIITILRKNLRDAKALLPIKELTEDEEVIQ